MFTFWKLLQLLVEERQQLVPPGVLQAYDHEFKAALNGLIQRTEDPVLKRKFVGMLDCPVRDARGHCRGFSEYILSALVKNGIRHQYDIEAALSYVFEKMMLPKSDTGEPRTTLFGGFDERRPYSSGFNPLQGRFLKFLQYAYGIGQSPRPGPSAHGIQWLPDARSWPAGSKLVQWVCLDPRKAPENLVLLAKVEGRFIHAASWGKFDAGAYQKDLPLAHWFLRAFYRHASGFLGWDDKQTAKSLPYAPSRSLDLGALPTAGEWIKLEVPLEKIGATNGLLDGIGFLHDGGRVWWGRTSIVGPANEETVIWGSTIGPPAEQMARARIKIANLKAGTRIRVLFEDRKLTAVDGAFVDDFRGADLYQRFGGGPYAGHGDTPVAVHIYELPSP